MKYVTICAIVAAGLLGTAASARGQESGGGELTAAVEAILSQARTQERASGEMAALVHKFRAMVADLRSNKRLPEKRAQELMGLMDALTATEQRHVRKAAQMLRLAYAQTEGRRERVDTAGTEVQNALDRLTALLRQANALRASELIRAELERILRAQEELMRRSRRVGGEVLAGQEKLSHDPRLLGGEQEALAGRTSGLHGLIRAARVEEETPEGSARLARADEFMEDEKIDARMLIAAGQMEKRDVIPAVTEQKDALTALRRLADILSQDEAGRLGEAAERVERIYRKQVVMREEVEGKGPEKFTQDAPARRLEEQGLKRQLAEAMKEFEKPAGDPSRGKEPKSGPGKKEPADGKSDKGGKGAEGGGSSTGKGQGGKDAPDRERDPMAGGAPGDKPGGPGQKAKDSMDKASEALGQRNQPAAEAGMRQAEKHLLDTIASIRGLALDQQYPGISPQLRSTLVGLSMAALTGQPMQPGALAAAQAQAASQSAAAAAKAAGDKPGKGSGGKPGPGVGATPGMGAGPGGPMPGGNLGRHGLTSLYGRADASGASMIPTLSGREQMALDESFAQELPREYRQMLKEYYSRVAGR